MLYTLRTEHPTFQKNNCLRIFQAKKIRNWIKCDALKSTSRFLKRARTARTDAGQKWNSLLMAAIKLPHKCSLRPCKSLQRSVGKGCRNASGHSAKVWSGDTEMVENMRKTCRFSFPSYHTMMILFSKFA